VLSLIQDCVVTNIKLLLALLMNTLKSQGSDLLALSKLQQLSPVLEALVFQGMKGQLRGQNSVEAS
jgi:hypothetical protein